MYVMTARGWRPFQGRLPEGNTPEHFDGTSIARAVPAPRDKTLAEQEGFTAYGIGRREEFLAGYLRGDFFGKKWPLNTFIHAMKTGQF